MGWGGPMPNAKGRMVGYNVKSVCDLEGCEEEINRGLAYVCGGMHDGGEFGCGKYFCPKHLYMGVALPEQMCEVCAEVYDTTHPGEVAAAIAKFERMRNDP